MKDQTANHDDWIGVPPLEGGATPTPKPSASQGPAMPFREGDTGLGTPDPPALAARDLTQRELEEIAQREEAESERQASEELAAIALENAALKVPAWLRTSVALLVVLIAGILTLFVTSQIASLVRDLAEAPPAWRWPLGIAGSLGTLAILFVLLRSFGFYVRLRRNRRVNLKGMRTLAQRRALRELGRRRLSEARAQLSGYVSEFPLEPKKETALKRAGLTAAQISNLRKQKETLLDKKLATSAEEWLEVFQKGFQSELEDAARRRVRAAIARVGFQTVASPLPIVDQAVVLYHSYGMLKDLCVIFNLRAGFFETIQILAQTVLNSYAAGGIQTLSLASVQYIGGAAGARLLRIVGGKSLEGAGNALMIAVLGRMAIRTLSPAVSSKS